MVERLFSLIDFLFSFKGRIGRLAYWAYSLGLVTVIISLAIALDLFDYIANDDVLLPPNIADDVLETTLFVMIIFGISWSSYAVQAKRWHDRDKSGWWSLVGFIPYIGGIWVLVECGFLRGTDGWNRYGDVPGSTGDNLAEVFE